MIVLSIGTDRKIFEPGSAARARMIEYGTLFKELHIIIFSLASSSYAPQQISENVWIYPTNSQSRFRYPFDALKTFKKMRDHVHPDVVTTQDPFETGLAGWLISRRTAIPLHIQIHTDFMSRYFRRGSWLNRIRVIIARWLLPKARAVRVVSERIKASLALIDQELPKRTTVLPIYTDVGEFKKAPISTDLHERYPQFTFIILMASRLTPEKNIPLALKIVRSIVIRHPEVGLVIVGDGPEKKYLEQLALNYHLDRNVVFESWQTDLASYYKTADVFLTTSLYEGYGLTLVEAAASGCPIVSSQVGIVSEIVEEGKTGFVCDVRYPEQFTEKLFALVENQKLVKAMKKQSQKVAFEKVSDPKEVYLASYRAILEAAVKKPNDAV